MIIHILWIGYMGYTIRSKIEHPNSKNRALRCENGTLRYENGALGFLDGAPEFANRAPEGSGVDEPWWWGIRDARAPLRQRVVRTQERERQEQCNAGIEDRMAGAARTKRQGNREHGGEDWKTRWGALRALRVGRGRRSAERVMVGPLGTGMAWRGTELRTWRPEGERLLKVTEGWAGVGIEGQRGCGGGGNIENGVGVVENGGGVVENGGGVVENEGERVDGTGLRALGASQMWDMSDEGAAVERDNGGGEGEGGGVENEKLARVVAVGEVSWSGDGDSDGMKTRTMVTVTTRSTVATEAATTTDDTVVEDKEKKDDAVTRSTKMVAHVTICVINSPSCKKSQLSTCET
ncbi:hypothetical protein OF83DRAFT_1084828 [Amylostereum chailletii]|nr:hypothetical protein OF83DRAFT_1084828 [Amylostereum chailletii]